MPSDETIKAGLYLEIARLKADREALRLPLWVQAAAREA